MEEKIYDSIAFKNGVVYYKTDGDREYPLPQTKEAIFVNVGAISFDEAHLLQEKYKDLLVHEGKKGNHLPGLILNFQVADPLINFGTEKARNIFASDVKDWIEKKYVHLGREMYASENEFSKTLYAHLEQDGVQGIDFRKLHRGGGATVHGPGQEYYYYIFDTSTIIKAKQPITTGTIWKRLINAVMLESIEKTLGTNRQVDISASENLHWDDDIDLYQKEDALKKKLGSKGIDITIPPVKPFKKVSLYGFCLHVDKDFITYFDKVHVCGSDPNEVHMKSIEEAKGKPISHDHLRSEVIDASKKYFNIQHIDIEAKENLYNSIRNIPSYRR